MSENPPNGPQYGGDPNPDQPDLNKPQNPGSGYPPPGNYPPQGGAPGGYPPPPANYPPQGGAPGGYPPPPGNYPPQGGYPPPPGNYPPQGGYPPPPGNYPPPPGNFGNYGNQGYGQPPMGTNPGRLDVGAALSYGFDKFKNNAGPWLGIAAIVWVVGVVVFIVTFASALTAAMAASDNGDSAAAATTTGVALVVSAIATFASYFINAAFVRGALDETGGPQKPSFGRFFQLNNLPQIAILALIVTVVSVVLGLIPILGTVLTIVLSFLASFALTFVLDRNQSAIDGIKSSVELTVKNLGPLVLLLLALAAINIVGALLCGLGLLVTIPVSVIALNYAYRVLTGGPLTPAR